VEVASGRVDAIAVDGLEKRYGDVQAVKGVTFAVARGETFGILGPNGAGKTTTLEMIEGLTRPDAGSIEILGQDVWPNPTRVQSHIGVQLQKNALFENLTAAELLDLFARFYGVALEGRAARLLAIVGLDEKADSQARQLSGGQQQRLAIALALVHDPEIVFLDEPTTGLDPQARRNLWDVIRAVAAENRTVVLTTHYLDEAETLCDRVAIMDGGRIIALDSPQALIDGLRGRSRVVFEGDGLGEEELAGLEGVQSVTGRDGAYALTSLEPQRTLLGLVALADGRGVEMRGLSVRQPTLEDVFLEATGTEFRE
jgi:ABC-2 type transport system ATP-binding protein